MSFLLKTLFVPTKNKLVAGFVPQTIAGEPSIFADMLPLAVNQFNTFKSPLITLSSGCSKCLFCIGNNNFQFNIKKGVLQPPV